MNTPKVHPNILFIVLDSFRADKCSGVSKTSITPNIDRLIKNGVYFAQTVSAADSTNSSLGAIFTGRYPFKTGISFYKNHSKASMIFDILKNNGYSRYASVPNTSFFQTVTSNFEDRDLSPVIPNMSLHQGVGKKIIDRLASKSMCEPWIYNIHLLDLHPTDRKFLTPDEFNSEKFGTTKYERAVSAIDIWIGKILQQIDLNNTLVILTGDHGDNIPVIETRLHDLGWIHNLMLKGRRVIPSLEPLGIKLFLFLRNLVASVRKRKLKRTLSSDEMRTINGRLGWDLYDEMVLVPLIFSGWKLPPDMVINQQTRHVDIFPTVNELIGLPPMGDADGISLVPLLRGTKLTELPIYIESTTTNPKSDGKVIGIRTSEYKYYRMRTNARKKVHLYNLKNDPQEKNNIESERQDIVIQMEKIIQKIENCFIKEELVEDDPDETKKIEHELRKLGYI